MENLFELSHSTGYLIYTYNTHILLRYKNKDNFSKSQILTSDYKENLCTILFDNSIYYSYIDLSNHLILRSLFDSNILYMMELIPDYYNLSPTLISFSGKILFFIEQADNNSNYLYIIFPFHPNISIKIDRPIQPNTRAEIALNRKYIFITISDENKSDFFLINKSFRINKIMEPSSEKKYQEIIEQKNQEIKRLNAIIESAKSQYDELMYVAKKYREEANKWANKF